MLELGMNQPGEIASLAKMARPHVAVITTIGIAHKEFFNSIEQIADAKAEVFDGLEPGGVAVLNRDNPHFARLADKAYAAGAREVRSFGKNLDSTARLMSADYHETGTVVTASVGRKHVAYVLSLRGAHWAMNSLAVLQIGSV